jgi:hypothetical protein
MASALILLSTLKDARYKAFSNGEDLNEAISDAEEAVRLTPVESIQRANTTKQLGESMYWSIQCHRRIGRP